MVNTITFRKGDTELGTITVDGDDIKAQGAGLDFLRQWEHRAPDTPITEFYEDWSNGYVVSKVSSDDIGKNDKHYPTLERAPGKKDNWVEQTGGLPPYIDKIARHLHYERGMPIGRAIATAVSRCRLWAAGGDGVKADTQAKAAKALAQWEAKKAKARAK